MCEQFPTYINWLKNNIGQVNCDRSDKDDLFPDGVTNTRRWIQTDAERRISDETFLVSDNWKKSKLED